jgi:hypothetical protein
MTFFINAQLQIKIFLNLSDKYILFLKLKPLETDTKKAECDSKIQKKVNT